MNKKNNNISISIYFFAAIFFGIYFLINGRPINMTLSILWLIVGLVKLIRRKKNEDDRQ